MSTTIADIIAAKNAALAPIDAFIADGQAKLTPALPDAEREQIEAQIRILLAKKTLINDKAAQAMDGSPELAAAIARLDQITADNSDVASHMPSVTKWLQAVATFLGLANEIFDAVKDLAP